MIDDYDDDNSPPAGGPPPPPHELDSLAAERSDWYAPEDDSRLRTLLFKYLPILFLCAIAFFPVWTRGGLLWQDDTHVTQNNPLKAAEGLWRLWWNPTVTPSWAPLSYSFLWPQRAIWAESQPLGYHLVSLFLHSFNAIMVWMLLKRLDIPGAFIAAIVFALHPLQVEPVAWISRQPMLLGTFWALLSSLLYIRYAGIDNTVVDPSKIFRFPETPWLTYTFAIVTYLLAILSQPLLVCTLPLVLLVVAWWKKESFTRADLYAILPLIVLGLAGAGLHWFVEYRRPDPERAFTALEVILVPARAVWFYLIKTVLPTNLATGYRQWEVSARDLLQWLALASLVMIGMALWLKRREIGRGAVAAMAAYLLLLLPMVTPLNRAEMADSYVADRFQYLAMVVPAAVIIAAVAAALGRVERDLRQWIAPTAAVTLALVLMFVSLLGRCQHFITPLAMWQNTARDERNLLARIRLGKVYQDQNNLTKALAEFESVDRYSGGKSLDAKIALGEIAEAEGKDLKLAAFYYQQAITVAPNRPEGYRKLGMVLTKQKSLDEAVKLYDQALPRFPGDAELHRLMGQVLTLQGKPDDAFGWFTKSLELNPNNALTHVDYGKALHQAKKPNEALEQFTAAIKIDPRNYEAFMSAGGLFLLTGNFDPALNCFRSASYLKDGRDADSVHMVGVTRTLIAQTAWQKGDLLLARNLIKEATTDLQRSIELNKDLPKARNNLEYARQLASRIDKGPPPRAATRATQPATAPATRP